MHPTVRGAKGTLHARIRKMEPGVYRAEYPGELNPQPNRQNPPERILSDYHLADSVEAAKYFVESMARELDYREVIWDELPE